MKARARDAGMSQTSPAFTPEASTHPVAVGGGGRGRVFRNDAFPRAAVAVPQGSRTQGHVLWRAEVGHEKEDGGCTAVVRPGGTVSSTPGT